MVVHLLHHQHYDNSQYIFFVDGECLTICGGRFPAKIKKRLNTINTDMSEKLLGDKTAELLKKAGVDKLARAYERLTKRPCNCKGRREALNNIQRMIKGQPVQKARPGQPTAPVDELPPKI